MTVTFANLTITATTANLERLAHSVRRLETLYIAGLRTPQGDAHQYHQLRSLRGLLFRVMDVLNGMVR